jgi:uncharacterized protein (DUF169 family)
MTQALDVQAMLGLRVPPIGIAFLDAVPAALQPWRGAQQPAGCAFWQRAQEGESFYTLPSDHYNCAVGAYTHAIDLPPERAGELDDTVGLMVENGYIEMAEVPGIPRLEQAPAAVAYGPADAPSFAPDLVLLTLTPAQAMLVYEAALRAGTGAAVTNLLGRPSCAVLPMTMSTSQAGVSLGCAGNRLYAGLRDDEMYVTIPGARWDDFKSRLAEIVATNERMGDYYRAHEADVAAR